MNALLLVLFGQMGFLSSNLPACVECSRDAMSVITSLSAQGFRCDFLPVSAQRGFRCQGRIPHYSMPVDIFTAPLLTQAKPVALAYHLHGFWTDPKTTPFDGNEGDFGRFVASSGKNIILIIPESRGKDRTYAQELDTPQRMTVFFNEVEKLLTNGGVTIDMSSPRALSGHSGAYVQMGKMGDWAKAGSVPQLRSLIAIGLFDTNFGYRAGIVNFMDAMCAAHGFGDYLIAFNPNDGSRRKRDTNARIRDELQSAHRCAQSRIAFIPDSATLHMDFPMKYMANFLSRAVDAVQ